MSILFPLTFCALLLRDAFAGPFRFYLDSVGLGILWFVPDVIGFLCVGMYFFRGAIVERNGYVIFQIAILVYATIVGVVFWDMSLAVAFASLKMLMPMYVGFAFTDRPLDQNPMMRRIARIVLYLSVLGVFLSSHYTFPWIGASTEFLGHEKEQARLWWSDEAQRYPGFSSVSTTASHVILMMFVMNSLYASRLWNAVWAALSLAAIYITTAKTTLAIMVVYVAMMVAAQFIRGDRLPYARKLARLSFLTVLVPPVLIILFSGTDLSQTAEFLSSMSDRIDNSWQLPFVFLDKMFPLGEVTGCGIGCFLFPLNYSSYGDYVVPIDNIYIANYIQFGFPYVIFIALMVTRAPRSDDLYKLISITLMNLFLMTVLGYGSSISTFFIGYMLSDGFRNHPDPLKAMPRIGARLMPLSEKGLGAISMVADQSAVRNFGKGGSRWRS